jgi:F0F1-type ATP synthase membrane subunit b/b'
VIPDITSLWVIGFLLTCTFLLKTLIFEPILRVIEARGQAVADARQMADTAADRANLATTEYTQKLNAARTDVYRAMDEKRRAALESRAALIGETRAMVERELADASHRLRQEADEARGRLEREADALAGVIVSRVLGRAS